MRQSASRKKTSERTEQTESGDVEVNFEEEDLATNIDEESEDEGKKNNWQFVIKTYSHSCCLFTQKSVII